MDGKSKECVPIDYDIDGVGFRFYDPLIKTLLEIVMLSS